MDSFLKPFKQLFIVKVLIALYLFFFTSDVFSQNGFDVPVYKIRNQELYNKIVALDSIYFTAYNKCDIKKQRELYSEDIEFFHNISGLASSKNELLKSIQKNVCGKISRHLIKGTIEVYEIPEYGAVEMGYHFFFNKDTPDAEAKPRKFVIVWQKTEKKWQITKVISLHK